MHNKPRNRALRLAVLSVLYLAPLAAQAQPGSPAIWRCGNQFSDRPCGDGQTLRTREPVQAPDSAEREAAQAATGRIRAQAEAMAHEREQREAAATSRGPALIARPAPFAEPAEAAERTPARAKRPQRPQRERARKPQADHFTAQGTPAQKKR